MGRRNLEMKRIEDKSSRQVTFSKRRSGLIKKARQLSVLCDVDVAVIVSSSHGKLYEFCSDGADSMELILSRYQKSRLLQAEEGTCLDMGIKNNMCTRFRTCNELLQSVTRVGEEGNEMTVSEMTELEEQLNAALMHTRSTKTQLMMDRISSFHKQEKKLREEKEELMKQQLVASAAAIKEKDDEVGGGVEQPVTTLPLFKDTN